MCIKYNISSLSNILSISETLVLTRILDSINALKFLLKSDTRCQVIAW